MLHPLKGEVSTIKLWLACTAKNLVVADPLGDQTSVCNMADLFGLCSPVRCSLTLSVLTSLPSACTPADYFMCEDIFVNTTDSVIDWMPTCHHSLHPWSSPASPLPLKCRQPPNTNRLYCVYASVGHRPRKLHM